MRRFCVCRSGIAGLMLLGVCMMSLSNDVRGTGGETNSPPRSDGCVLHVDFENYIDGYYGALNAGVRSVGDPFTGMKEGEVAVLADKAVTFAGRRCGYAFTDQKNKIGRIKLQRRYDAPAISDEVIEFVFRPVKSSAVDLDTLVVWYGQASLGQPGGLAGIVLTANGSKADGRYNLDVRDDEGKKKDVVKGLKQDQWIRVIMHRNTSVKTVDLWVGPPDQEKKIGTFKDLSPTTVTGRAEIGDTSDNKDLGSGYWDDIRVGKRLVKGKAIAPPEKTLDLSKEKTKIEYPIEVGKEKQLFVDDVLIESMADVKKTLHPVKKHPGNPLLKWDKPWEQNASYVLPMTVLKNDKTGKYRLWYSVYNVTAGKRVYSCVADSDDGIHWTRPNLGLFEFEGSKANNIIRQGRAFRVLYDPTDPDPGNRYKAAIRDAGFLASFSPDGLKWTTTVPILEQAYDATSVHWNPVEKTWIASCKVFLKGKGRIRGYAESKDFVHWTDTYPILTTDDRDDPKDQLYSMSISRYESVFIGQLMNYHLGSDKCDVELAFSRDAKHWVRPIRTAFIPNSHKKGDWDYGNINPPENIIREGNELRFYYSGRKTLHDELPGISGDGRLGLGTLRIDGFVSVDGGANEGFITTRPVVLKGKSLYVNADAAGGQVLVEILEAAQQDTTTDNADVALYPYFKNDCRPISGDVIRAAVQWKSTASLSALDGKEVRLRFYLKNAKLYSFWTE